MNHSDDGKLIINIYDSNYYYGVWVFHSSLNLAFPVLTVKLNFIQLIKGQFLPAIFCQVDDSELTVYCPMG